MAKTEKLILPLADGDRETGIRRTLFAACPNSTAVIKAAFRAAKRNNAPIYFAATLNQIDCDGGYTGMRPDEFVKLVRMEAAAVNFDGIYIVAIDHGGPWLKDKQRTEKWSTEAAMDGVKRSFEAALLAGYDLIHVDPTVDINVPAGQTIDIRLVAATSEDLEAAIARGTFRADLYHRINSFTLRMPCLRQMRGDIPLFADFFLDQANRELDKRIVGFDAAAAAALAAYDWPGNLRQLKNAVMSATLLAAGEYITCRDLPAEVTGGPAEPAEAPLSLRDPASEEEQIRRALATAGGNKSQAAKLLGIDRKTLYNKLHLYGIE